MVLEAGSMANGGEIFILDMGEPVRILDVAEKMILLSGMEPYKDINIEFIGLRPGEKLYEELCLSEESMLNTKHDKIHIATIIAEPDDRLRQSITELQQAVTVQNRDNIMQVLQKAVPTYQLQRD